MFIWEAVQALSISKYIILVNLKCWNTSPGFYLAQWQREPDVYVKLYIRNRHLLCLVNATFSLWHAHKTKIIKRVILCICMYAHMWNTDMHVCHYNSSGSGWVLAEIHFCVMLYTFNRGPPWTDFKMLWNNSQSFTMHVLLFYFQTI